MENKCNKCGKIEDSGLFYNGLCLNCWRESIGLIPQYPTTRMGWECPRCYQIHAPWVPSCGCPPTTWTCSTYTTSPVTVCNTQSPPVQTPKTWEDP